jgi:hypothetical protein
MLQDIFLKKNKKFKYQTSPMRQQEVAVKLTRKWRRKWRLKGGRTPG